MSEERDKRLEERAHAAQIQGEKGHAADIRSLLADYRALRAKMIGYEQEADRLTCENVDLRAERDRLRDLILAVHEPWGVRQIIDAARVMRALASGEEIK